MSNGLAIGKLATSRRGAARRAPAVRPTVTADHLLDAIESTQTYVLMLADEVNALRRALLDEGCTDE